MRPIIHAAAPSAVLDFSDRFPADQWNTSGALTERAGNVVTLTMALRPLSNLGTVDIMVMPGRFLPSRPLLLDMITPASGVRTGRVFINSATGVITIYGTVTVMPSTQWSYCHGTWVTPHPM